MWGSPPLGVSSRGLMSPRFRGPGMMEPRIGRSLVCHMGQPTFRGELKSSG